MTAYREIIRTPQDIAYVADLLKKLDTATEVIIVPLEDNEQDLKSLQIVAMAKTWDNKDDEAWNEL